MVSFDTTSLAVVKLSLLVGRLLCQSSLVYGDCGASLTETYLAGIKNTNVNNFAPSVYYTGGSTKFISTRTDQTELEDEYLCVDGGTSSPGPIQLYDDGTHGDDFANDGVYTRDCVHFCAPSVDLSDIFGFAMESDINGARLVVMDASIEGTVPYKVVDTPLTPGIRTIASSHAFFFADVNRRYYPDFPNSLSPNGAAAPSGKSLVVSAVLQVFGDVFDYVTFTPLERSNGAIEGAGIYKWTNWDRRGGSRSNNEFGRIDQCSIALNGIPPYRIHGVISNNDVVTGDGFGGQLHELAHGVSGYEFSNNLKSIRHGDRMHVPGACTFDHSSLQATVWDWVKGYPYGILRSDGSDSPGIRLVPNDDCETCSDNSLTTCCSFRYEDRPKTKAEMLAHPELATMSPLLLYIAGMLKFNEVPADQRTYYCFGSDTDGGCGEDEKYDHDKACVIPVNENDRSKVTSSYVSRFSFEDLVNANGGKRYPEEKFKVVRHAAVHVSSREPSEAEIAFYTLLWRHHEVETEPWQRINVRSFIEPWQFHTSGNSILHSRLHGIDCGANSFSTRSCERQTGVCAGAPCGPGAVCKNLDGQPLCICREGLVGDGVECAYPSETDFEGMSSAYDSDSECFPKDAASNNIWTDFTEESSLPPYPGGQAPYSATSCFGDVCPAGWRCNKNKGCLPPSGKSMCKNKGFSKGQCEALGCCKWEAGACQKEAKSCPTPVDPKAAFACDDLSTCCYFPCRRLKLDDGPQISQVGNCGGDCTFGITPALNGVVYPELYLLSDGYYTNGEWYGFDQEGPLNVEGTDKNMFNRCMDQCWGEEDVPTAKFLLKIKNSGQLVKKSCNWLATRANAKKKKVCSNNKYNLSTQGYESARLACPQTCAPYLSASMNISDPFSGVKSIFEP